MSVTIPDALKPLLRAVVSLTEYPKNSQKHDPKDVEKFAGVLAEFGWTQPIIAWAHDGKTYISAGHLRYRAAVKAGLTEVPVLVREDWTERQFRAYTIADNAWTKRAEWDVPILKDELVDLDDGEFDLMLTGFDKPDVYAMIHGKAGKPGLTDDDAVPEAVQPRSKTGDVWLCGRHRVMCGDSTKPEDVARLMAGEKADAMVFDPEWDAVPSVPLLSDRLVFADGGRVGDAVALHGTPRWLFVWDCVSSWYVPGQPLRRIKVDLWYGSGDFDADGAHYGEPGEERVVANSRGQYRYRPDPRGKHLADLFQRPITQEHRDGPSHSKPVDWLRLLIADCLPGASVHDPFLGSGTTLIACEKLDRVCYGMEIEPRYVDVAVRRWEQFTGKTATLESHA